MIAPQLENAVTLACAKGSEIAQSLSIEEQRELLDLLSELVNKPEEDIEPSADEIAASLQRALHKVKTGQAKPISELWDSLDAE